MSQENVEIVRAVYERWSEGDFRAAVDLFDSNVVLVIPPGFLEPGTFVGVQGVSAFTRSFLKDQEHLTMTAEEIISAGDSVLVSVHQHGVGSASGAPTEMSYCSVWSFRGPKVIRLESFRERADALEAAGLSE